MPESDYYQLVDEFVSKQPDEITFHCISILRSAIETSDEATREALLFVLMEKLLALYQLIE